MLFPSNLKIAFGIFNKYIWHMPTQWIHYYTYLKSHRARVFKSAKCEDLKKKFIILRILVCVCADRMALSLIISTKITKMADVWKI